MRFILVLSFLLFFSNPALALPEANLAELIKTKVSPYLLKNLKFSSFKSYDQKTIVYATVKVQGSRGTIFISPGRSESIIGQSEVIYDLAHAGYSVAVIDHRGQGFSERLVKSDAGHVESFDDYVRDYQQFYSEPEVQNLPRPFYLVASSMGAAITTQFVLDQHSAFSAVVLVAPFFKMSVGYLGGAAVTAVADSMWWAGYGDSYAPTRTPYDYAQKFEGNVFTSSPARFYNDVALTKLHPEIAVGGATVSWLRASLMATAKIRANAAKFEPPTLIIQAADDEVVAGDVQTKFCASAVDCRLKSLTGAKHWLLMERDEIRNRAFLDILAFIETGR
ncbi:MAG: alpha/beta fold hydrolase [Proteobacteria bacterium]|nr:MAG: alpha/beta fold hydrolase [Pseudomonadota bacterium]